MKQLVDNYIRYQADVEDLQKKLQLVTAELKSAQERAAISLSNLLHEAASNPGVNDRRYFHTEEGILEVTSKGVQLLHLEE